MPGAVRDIQATDQPDSFATTAPAELAWALLNDTSSAVLLIDESLRIVDANANALAQRNARHEEAAGRDATAYLSDWIAGERRAVLREVLDTGRTIRLVGMLFGTWTKSTHRRVHRQHDDRACVLIVNAASAHCLPMENDDRVDTRRAARQDLGALARLTERELEVLRLIGLGLTSAEIARQLYRSVKTIEGHRLSLGYKLNAAGRVELVRIACESGLVHLSADDVVRVSRDSAESRTRRRREEPPDS